MSRFPCPKCGLPINGSQGSREYLGTTEPNEKGERYRYFKCPACLTVLKRKIET